MSSKFLIKLCEICGDKSVGRNFGAITCDSCKTFFRRNAVKNIPFDCSFGDKCIINVKTRRKCKRCRLLKCYAFGMKKELILIEKQKKFNSNANQTNIQTITVFKTEFNDSDETTPEGAIPKGANDDFLSVILSNCLLSDSEINEQIMEIENCLFDTQNDIVFSGYDRDVKRNDCSVVPVFRHITNENNFNDIEFNRVSELLNASKCLKYPSIKDDNRLQLTNISEIFKLYNIFVEEDLRDAISFIKGLSSFSDLCSNDQLILVKYGSFDTVSLRTILYYNIESENWFILFDNNISLFFNLDSLKERHMYGVYKNYFNKFIPECKRDSVVLVLLFAIALFNPDRPNLRDRSVIKFHQQMYIYLLQRYLQMRYRSQFETNSKVSQLMNVLIDLKMLRDVEIRNAGDDFIQYYGPLFKEILDF